MATPQSPTATNQREKPATAPTRSRLLDAAYELLVQDGYHATTVQSVARRAGLTTGAIYANFANKQELMALAVLDRWTVLQQDLLPLVAPPGDGDDSFHLRLVAHLAQHLTAPTAPEHRLLTEVTGAVLRDGGAVSPLLSGVQMLETLARASIDAGKAEGRIDEKLPTDAIVTLIVNLYLGTITSKAWGLEQPKLDEIEAVLSAVNRGLASGA